MAEEMRSADIQQAVELAAKTYGAVGVQATVIRGGVTGETYVYGWATKDTDPMTPNHKFRTASITKIATGIAAMLLREQGVLRLEDPGSGAKSQPSQYSHHHPKLSDSHLLDQYLPARCFPFLCEYGGAAPQAGILHHGGTGGARGLGLQ